MHFFIGSGVFSWISKKQQLIALATAEAKYIATTNSATQVLWLRRILGVLQYKRIDLTKIYCDSKSAIESFKNLVLHGCNKHIGIKYHFTRELVRDRERLKLIIAELNSKRLTFFTKILKIEIFVELKNMLGMSKLEETGLMEAI